jgi:hypothetical protein
MIVCPRPRVFEGRGTSVSSEDVCLLVSLTLVGSVGGQDLSVFASRKVAGLERRVSCYYMLAKRQ